MIQFNPLTGKFDITTSKTPNFRYGTWIGNSTDDRIEISKYDFSGGFDPATYSLPIIKFNSLGFFAGDTVGAMQDYLLVIGANVDPTIALADPTGSVLAMIANNRTTGQISIGASGGTNPGVRVGGGGAPGATTNAFLIGHHFLGSGSAGDGIQFSFEHLNGAFIFGNRKIGNYFTSIQNDPTVGSEDYTMHIGGITAGASADWLTLTGLLANFQALNIQTSGGITGTSFTIGANILTTSEFSFLDGINQTVATTSSPTFANLILTAGGKLKPSADSTTAINIAKSDGTNLVSIDTTKRRISLSNTTGGAIAPGVGVLDIVSDFSISGVPNSRMTRYWGTSAPSGGQIQFRTARGTEAAPTKLLTNDLFAVLGGNTYHGSGWSTGGNKAFYGMFAAEDFDDNNNQGTYHGWCTTSIDSTTPRIRMYLTPSGTLFLGDGDNTPVIGTDFVDISSTYKLHLDMGTATAVYQKFTANATTGRTATDGFDIGIDASGNAEIRQRENLPISFYTNNTLALTIAANQAATFASTVDATGFKAGGTAAVADGTYNTGIGPLGNMGTITTKGGIITAITQAS